jgi:hypothetical protein
VSTVRGSPASLSSFHPLPQLLFRKPTPLKRHRPLPTQSYLLAHPHDLTMLSPHSTSPLLLPTYLALAVYLSTTGHALPIFNWKLPFGSSSSQSPSTTSAVESTLNVTHAQPIPFEADPTPLTTSTATNGTSPHPTIPSDGLVTPVIPVSSSTAVLAHIHRPSDTPREPSPAPEQDVPTDASPDTPPSSTPFGFIPRFSNAAKGYAVNAGNYIYDEKASLAGMAASTAVIVPVGVIVAGSAPVVLTGLALGGLGGIISSEVENGVRRAERGEQIMHVPKNTTAATDAFLRHSRQNAISTVSGMAGGAAGGAMTGKVAKVAADFTASRATTLLLSDRLPKVGETAPMTSPSAKAPTGPVQVVAIPVQT